jgi:hypothetical protein
MTSFGFKDICNGCGSDFFQHCMVYFIIDFYLHDQISNKPYSTIYRRVSNLLEQTSSIADTK